MEVHIKVTRRQCAFMSLSGRIEYPTRDFDNNTTHSYAIKWTGILEFSLCYVLIDSIEWCFAMDG